MPYRVDPLSLMSIGCLLMTQFTLKSCIYKIIVLKLFFLSVREYGTRILRCQIMEEGVVAELLIIIHDTIK